MTLRANITLRSIRTSPPVIVIVNNYLIPMHILLNRYYGNPNITKSTFTATIDGKTVLECEARESAYCDYSAPFPRHSFFCLPTGTHRCFITSSAGNRFCLRVAGVSGHRGTKIYIENSAAQHHIKAVLLGYADPEVKPKWRRLIKQDELRERFTELLSRQIGEEISLEVRNESCVSEDV